MYSNYNANQLNQNKDSNPPLPKPASTYGAPGRPMGNQAIFGPQATTQTAPPSYGSAGRPMGNPAIFGPQTQSSTPSYSAPVRPMGNPAIFGPQATQPAANNFGGPRVAGGNTGIGAQVRPGAFAGNNTALRQITLSELSDHDNADSLWIGFKGYVYDATQYRHSGGAQAILRGAGKDATQMIARQHGWVKVDEMLKDKRVGVLVVEANGDDSDDD